MFTAYRNEPRNERLIKWNRKDSDKWGPPLRKVRGQLDEHSIGDDQSDIAKVFTTALSLSLSLPIRDFDTTLPP